MGDGLVDLWIDGKVHRVPHAVLAHVNFLTSLNARLAHVATVSRSAARDLLNGMKIMPQFHWTAAAKEELLLAIREGSALREEVKQRYEISEEELAGWERAYAQHGVKGLSARKLRRGEGR